MCRYARWEIMPSGPESGDARTVMIVSECARSTSHGPPTRTARLLLRFDDAVDRPEQLTLIADHAGVGDSYADEVRRQVHVD